MNDRADFVFFATGNVDAIAKQFAERGEFRVPSLRKVSETAPSRWLREQVGPGRIRDQDDRRMPQPAFR